MNEVVLWTEMKRAADFGQIKLSGEGENNYDPLSSKLNLMDGEKNPKTIEILASYLFVPNEHCSENKQDLICLKLILLLLNKCHS